MSGTPPAIGWKRCPRSTGSSSTCCRASTGRSKPCSRTPAASPRACRPTMPCSGASRGAGKSSIVKAVHAHVNRELGGPPGPLALIEIHREDIPSLPALLRPHPRDRPALRGVLRRPLVRRPGRRLQVAEGSARGRHRGPPGERRVLRHLQPPPPDAARHDRERALDRDQSFRGGGRESLAVGPLRPVAGLPQRRPGHLLRHDRGLRRALQASASRPRSCASRRSNGR